MHMKLAITTGLPHDLVLGYNFNCHFVATELTSAAPSSSTKASDSTVEIEICEGPASAATVSNEYGCVNINWPGHSVQNR